MNNPKSHPLSQSAALCLASLWQVAVVSSCWGSRTIRWRSGRKKIMKSWLLWTIPKNFVLSGCMYILIPSSFSYRGVIRVQRKRERMEKWWDVSSVDAKGSSALKRSIQSKLVEVRARVFFERMEEWWDVSSVVAKGSSGSAPTLKLKRKYCTTFIISNKIKLNKIQAAWLKFVSEESLT